MSRSARIAKSLQQQILNGTFRCGDRLPSIREIAQKESCSINTVISALEQLVASGLAEPRRGSGFYVLPQATNTGKSDDEPRSLERAMDIVWLMREQLRTDPDKLCIGDGFPPVSWLEGNRIDKHQQHALRNKSSTLFRYGSRCGYFPLRQLLASRLSDYSITCSANQIVLTHGANQAMDIVIRHFICPGDTVFVDDPGYYPLLGKLKLQGANIVGIPRLPDGPDIDAVEREIGVQKPKLFFTQSVGQNPTGSDISPAKAHRILQLAEKHGVVIVENDPLAALKPSSATRISALDQLNRTIYIGSFSKSISAALRVGFIACHPDLASDLADVKMLIHVSSSEFCERTVEGILNDGHYQQNIARIRERMERATDSAIAIFEKLGGEIFCRPKQSLYLWCRLPGLQDSIEVAKQFIPKKIVIAPGCIFSVNAQYQTPWCRYNVGFATDSRFQAAAKSIIQS